MSLDHIIEDVVRKRGPLVRNGQGSQDYQECWDAFNRYVSSVLEKKQTLSMSNFCKIGWRIEEHPDGKVKLRPHFQIYDSFAKAYNIDTRRMAAVSDKALTVVEEFNFSKAAIRFSKSLTKEVLFMGLRALLQSLGERMSSGQAVSMDFEVGKLRCSDGVVTFDFAAEMFAREGLEAPRDSASKPEYRPSSTFAPPTQDAYSLNVQGKSDRQVKSFSAFLGGGWDDDASVGGQREDCGGKEDVSRCDIVASNHLHRHLTRIEEDAAQVVAEKKQWEEHLKRIVIEDENSRQHKKALTKEYAKELSRQVHEVERRREEGRQFAVQQASEHGFPCFAESPDRSAYDSVRDRKQMFKEDLDKQIEIKRRLKMIAKKQEQDMEASHVEASKQELMQMRMEANSKKELERALLHQAWDKDKRLHVLRKTIDEYHRTPATKAVLSSAGCTVADVTVGTPRLTLGSAMSPPSHCSDNGISCQGPSRPVTGSVRRVPLGAAASLALHKEKMRQTARR